MSLSPRLTLCAQALIVLAFVLLISVFVSWGQSAGYTVSGAVRDDRGNGVGNAHVWAIQVDNGSATLGEGVTDGRGMYDIPGLPVGSYAIHASRDGHEGSLGVDMGPGDLSAADLIIHGLNGGGSGSPATVAATSRLSSPAAYAHAAGDLPPVVQINTSWKRAYRMEPLTFDAGATYDPDGSITAYEWDFGDGSMGEGAAIQHSYRDAGKYSVQFKAVDNSGSYRSAYVTAIISSRPPVPVPGNDTSATVGEVVRFDGSASYGRNSTIVRYDWSFGDGTFGEGVNVSHAYGRPDKYKVELTVTDDGGANATAFMSVNVTRATVAPQQAAKPENSRDMVLLAGLGVAIVAAMVLMRKKAK